MKKSREKSLHPWFLNFFSSPRLWEREQLYGSLFAFFLARATILETLHPFGIAFYAALLATTRGATWPVAGAVLLGTATILRGGELGATVAVIFILWLVIRLYPPRPRKQKLLVPLWVGLVNMLLKMGRAAFFSAGAETFLVVFCESCLATLLTFISLVFLETIWRGKRFYELEKEEAACYLLLGTGVLAGIEGLRWGDYALLNLISDFFVLLAAYTGGSGMGAALGVVLSLIPMLSSFKLPTLIGLYAFSGFLAGLLRDFQKPGVSLGFLLGNLILSPTWAQAATFKAFFTEALVATLIFFLVPASFTERLAIFFPVSPFEAQGEIRKKERIKKLVNLRLRILGKAFEELAATFQEKNGDESPAQDLSFLFQQVNNLVCKECSLFKYCWEENLAATSKLVLEVLNLNEKRESITLFDLSPALRTYCRRPTELICAVTFLSETRRLNSYWQQRKVEVKTFFQEHFKELAAFVFKLAGQIQEEGENYLARKIKKELGYLGLRGEVQAWGTGEKELEVSISSARPCRDALFCRQVAAPAVAQIVNKPLELFQVHCPWRTGAEECNFKLLFPGFYKLEVGFAQLARNGEVANGDSLSFFRVPGNKGILLISDGLGSGEEAARKSRVLVSLAELLLAVGFGAEATLNLLNGALAFDEERENFSTFDFALIDLNSGEAQFIKLGAAPTFLKRGEKVKLIAAQSPPLGVLWRPLLETKSCHLLPGDLVVMVSDGVLEVAPGETNFWLVPVLEKANFRDAQAAADYLLQEALSYTSGRARDDLTVLVGFFSTCETDQA